MNKTQTTMALSKVHSSSKAANVAKVLLRNIFCVTHPPVRRTPVPPPNHRVPTLLLIKKSRTFPGLSRTPMKNFPGPFRSPRMFKYKEKNGIYLQYSECSPLQKIQREAKCYLSKQQSTQTGCYTIAACFPFQPLEKCMTFKDIYFRTFQDRKL